MCEEIRALKSKTGDNYMKIIAHLSMTPTLNDARIERAVRASEMAGLSPVVVAPGAGFGAAPPGWRSKAGLAIRYVLGGFLGKKVMARLFWTLGVNKQALAALLDAAPDIIVSHDWSALPIAARGAQILKCRLIYDSHEYASQLHIERTAWRLTMLRGIRHIERLFVNQADAVVTVSPGIAAQLQIDYGLKERPTLFRNMPKKVDVPVTTTKTNGVLLHYHGILAPGRGLEGCINALCRLPDMYRLRFVGPERSAGYLELLKEMAVDLGVADRLVFHEALPSDELVRFAADADFGLCLLTDDSVHNRFALPNKLFEYYMAGIIPVVSGSADMAAFVREVSCGENIASYDDLPALLMSYREEKTIGERRKCHAVGKLSCFENEAPILVNLYRKVADL